MTVLEAGLRGAAMALLLLLAIVGWRDARHAAVARYSVLIDLCAVAYLIQSAPPITALDPVWIVPSKHPPAEPGAFVLGPLEAAIRGR